MNACFKVCVLHKVYRCGGGTDKEWAEGSKQGAAGGRETVRNQGDIHRRLRRFRTRTNDARTPSKAP